MVGAELLQFISFARPGATLHISKNYELPTSLTVSKPLNLIGVGPGRPTISFAGAGWALMFAGAGPWRVEGIDFLHAGGVAGDVVRVSGGVFYAYDCTFAGGMLEQHLSGGIGFSLNGDAVGTLDNCRFDRNGVGLSITDRAHGVVRGCRCAANLYHGIQVRREGRGELRGNAMLSNGSCGVFYDGSTAGEARGNLVAGNGGHGVQLLDNAHPDLIDNHCEGSGACGICYFQTASGRATGSVCARNGSNGINAQEAAHPFIEGNYCHGNGLYGVILRGQAHGLVRANVCTDNQRGVGVGEDARVALVGNRCEGNRQNAFTIAPSADVSFCDNLGEVVYDDCDEAG